MFFRVVVAVYFVILYFHCNGIKLELNLKPLKLCRLLLLKINDRVSVGHLLNRGLWGLVWGGRGTYATISIDLVMFFVVQCNNLILHEKEFSYKQN